MAAKRPPKAQVAWSQVKAKLADFDRAGLIALLQDLYAASKKNQAFLHSRFGLGGDPLEPCKQAIQDVFRHLSSDMRRTETIAADVRQGYREGRKLLVLTERTDHR